MLEYKNSLDIFQKTFSETEQSEFDVEVETPIREVKTCGICFKSAVPKDDVKNCDDPVLVA